VQNRRDRKKTTKKGGKRVGEDDRLTRHPKTFYKNSMRWPQSKEKKKEGKKGAVRTAMSAMRREGGRHTFKPTSRKGKKGKRTLVVQKQTREKKKKKKSPTGSPTPCIVEFGGQEKKER